MSKFTDVSQRGTNGARPAANAVSIGALYFDTTNNQMTRSNGSTWDVVEGSGGMTNPMTTADDIIVGGSSGTPTRKAKGGNNTVWGVDGSGTLGYKADPAGGSGNVTTTSAYASPPATPASGDLWLPSDGFSELRYSGSAQVPWGPLFPLTIPPNAASWTWANQGSATLTDSKGALYFTEPAQGSTANNLRVIYKAKPAGTNWTVVACILPLIWRKDYQLMGICFRESSSGKMHTAGFFHNVANGGMLFNTDTYASATSYNASYTTQPLTEFSPLWLKIQDDNTNRLVFIGTDGQNWVQIDSQTRTNYLTADQYGFYIQCRNAATPNMQAAMTILSVKEN